MCLRIPNQWGLIYVLFTFSSLHIAAVEVEAGWRQDGSRTGEKEPNAIRPVTYAEGGKAPGALSTPTDNGMTSRCLVAVPVDFPPNKTEIYRKVERAGLR